MVGKVDEYGRALLPITIRRDASTEAQVIEAWIDTGFTGELMLPRNLIESRGLTEGGTEVAGLGDGSKVTLPRFKCCVNWFGEIKRVDVLAHQGRFPLLGVALRAGHQLKIDYERCDVTVD